MATDAVGPRRKTHAGPWPAQQQQQHFTVTSTFVRSKDPNDVQNQLRGVQATEELTISGHVNVMSTVVTTKECFCVKYTEEYDYLVGGFTDGKVRLFSSTTSKCTSTLFDSEIEENSAPVTGLKHRPVNKNYPIINCVTATYANGLVKCWNYNFNNCVYTIREKRQTFGLAYHPRLPKFLTFGDDCKMYFYDEETKIQERVLAGSDLPGMLDGHSSRVFAACFNPMSNHELVTGGWDNVVFFWDLRQPYALRHLSNVHMCGEGIDISATGREILTCAWQEENPIQLWDYGSGQLLLNIEPDVFSSKLYCGRFIGQNYFICGGSSNNLLRLVDKRTNFTVGSISGFNKGVYSIDLGPVKKLKKEQTLKTMEVLTLPKVGFSSGTKIYQIDFSSNKL